MRKIDFIIFFSIVFLIYGLINFYIFRCGWDAVTSHTQLKYIYLILFIILSLSFFAGRFLERVTCSWISTAFVWVGSFWLAAMTYFFLIAMTIDLFRLVNHFVHFFPRFFYNDYQITKLITLSFAIIIVMITVCLGHINAIHPRLKTLNLNINKRANSIQTLNIAVASDIHLGTIINNSRLEKIVDSINALHPDIVLFPGDVVDEDVGQVIKQNLGETLRKIQSKYGVYAVTGNHEYIGGVEPACKYLTDHGITMLRDTTIKIAESFYIVGREDRDCKRFAGKERKALTDLLNGIDRNLPIILMDHQPFHLNETQEQGIDLQLSGHTHHGQLWPLNFITKKVYEISWGYLKKGNTHFYVSCGVGTWGPPVRTGNRPEIVNIKLTFEKK